MPEYDIVQLDRGAIKQWLQDTLTDDGDPEVTDEFVERFMVYVGTDISQ